VAAQKHIVIGGGSGFIGSVLTDALRKRGDRVTWISRQAGEERMTWDDLAREGLPDCDVVVNFAGQHILDMSRRWTAEYRDEVIQSRIRTTKTLVTAINKKASPPDVFISTAGKCFYVGATIGKGTQIFPWIHIDDMAGIILHVIDNQNTEGRYNAVSPNAVTNKEFTQAFSKYLKRPIMWSVPAWLVKAVVGEERSSILLKGQLVRPRRTVEAGYKFQYPEIDGAMADLVKITF